MLFSLSHTTVPPDNPKGRQMDVKKKKRDKTRPIGSPLMEVDPMHRFWTFLPFYGSVFQKKLFKKSTFLNSALSCPDCLKSSSKNDQSMNSLSSSSPSRKSLKKWCLGCEMVKSYYTAIKHGSVILFLTLNLSFCYLA